MTDDDPHRAAAWSTAWSELAPPFRRCVELAWESCSSGTFACGAVVTDPAGNVVAEGRNRVFDAPSGEYPLEGTALAHAEMNALARVPAGVEGLPSLNAFVERRWPLHHEPHDGQWAVLGQTLALHLLAFWQPVGSQALAAHDRCEPEVAALVRRWVDDRTLVDLASTGAKVERLLAAVWDDVSEAAEARDSRRADRAPAL